MVLGVKTVLGGERKVNGNIVTVARMGYGWLGVRRAYIWWILGVKARWQYHGKRMGFGEVIDSGSECTSHGAQNLRHWLIGVPYPMLEHVIINSRIFFSIELASATNSSNCHLNIVKVVPKYYKFFQFLVESFIYQLVIVNGCSGF